MEFSSDLMLWATRFALSALIVVVWTWVIHKKILPFTRRSISTEERSTGTFPTVWIVLATTLTVFAYWFVTLQPIERTTTVPDRTLENRRQNAAQERVKDVPLVAPDTRETLEQRAERVRAESEAQNQRAKDDFKALKEP